MFQTAAAWGTGHGGLQFVAECSDFYLGQARSFASAAATTATALARIYSKMIRHEMELFLRMRLKPVRLKCA